MAYDFENISVLIIEDNAPMLGLLKSLLNVYGFQTILTARDGEEGYRVFQTHKPDLVITDWMMKPVDGISLSRRIRNDARSPAPFTPIILMTGFSQLRRVMQARDAGVTEFIVKPFNARDLYRRISQIIEKPRQFVRSEDFFGPDRRRKTTENYNGPQRRDEDSRSLIDKDVYYVDDIELSDPPQA
ncbi:MAG: response regulator [Alphaproteobacteria bacterium]|nr:response regulator [Alphaproteobacteria bacterium]